MAESNPNWLLVEGDKDKRVIPHFMEKNSIPWGNDPSTRPVHIKAFGGDGNMLKLGIIETELKRPGLKTLGIVADAEGSAEDRWKRIRQRALKSLPDLPETLPEDGLVCMNTDGLRFGVRVMPDNRNRGMMETFLHSCVPSGQQPLWTFVEFMCLEAKKHGAPYKDVHLDKAKIHAWLALQDQPGPQLHDAVKFNTLKPESPHAAKFVQWFRSLYSL